MQNNSECLAAVKTERAKLAVDIVHLEETLRVKRERFSQLSFYANGFEDAQKVKKQHEEA